MPLRHCRHGNLMFRTTILLVQLLIVAVALAQPTITYRFKTISINEGLSQGFVSGITKDKKGLMWFTTSDGLNKYDGYSCKVYHHDVDDSSSLASDDLTCVFEDSKERLWVGTRNDGLDLFDRASNSFIHFKAGKNNSIRSDEVINVTEDKNGGIWIRTAAGIDHLSIQPDTNTGALRYLFKPIPTPVKTAHSADNIFIDSRNRIFICNPVAVYEYISTSSMGDYKLEKRFAFSDSLSEFIPAMLEDTINHSLLVNARHIISFPDYNFSYPQLLYHNTRSDISWTIDSQNKLLLAGVNEIIEINLSSGETNRIVASEAAQMKAIRAATTWYTDETGVVWLGSGGHGVLQHDPEIEKFQHLIPGESVYGILEQQPGVIFTNDFASVTLTNRALPVDSSLRKTLRVEGKLPEGLPLTLARDASGNIWYGLNTSLVQYNPLTRKITAVKIPYSDVSSIPFPVFADNAHNLWMGYKNWLLRYDIISDIFTRYHYPDVLPEAGFDFLQTICADENLLWLGTVDGLRCFDMANERMLPAFKRNQKDSSTISNNFILSICRDFAQPGRFLWVGTKGGGLNRLDKFSNRFERFTTKNGLPNNVVYGIVPDYAGNLWLSTNKGIAAFNTQSGNIRNFDVADGLQSNEFNRYGYLRTLNGRIAFSGMNGITLFNPEDIKPLPPPGVILTELRLFNKVMSPFSPNSPLTREIDLTEKLELLYEQNVITFRFAATDYRRHAGVRYRYKMLGFDEDWIYSGNNNEATFTNLDAGDYQLMIQSSFDETNWSQQPKVIKIFVLAPWWQTWWFKIFVITGTVSVAYALYRYRIHQISLLEALRNRIARDLHDEVGSSISTIAIYSKIMHEQMQNATFNNETLLKKINDHAAEIMESMDDIIWNINTKNDAFESIISRMREHAFQLLEAKEYLLHFTFDENLYRMQLPMEQRRDFYLIYKEALNNIAKYAEGKNVWITLSITETGIQLTITDDGKGFDINNIKKGKGGNGITNIQHRANMLNGKISIDSTPDKGTSIQLTF